MPSWIRKLLAVLALSAALLFSPLAVAHADTPSPSPTSSATSSATPSASEDSGDDADMVDAPDVQLDQTRTVVLLAGAGALALAAALVVLIRR